MPPSNPQRTQLKAPLARGTAGAAARLRLARRSLLDNGSLPVDALDEPLARSWQRSQQLGLSPTGRPAGAPHASAAQLARALAQHRELVAHARPVMEFLFARTHDSDGYDSDGMVILADADGMLLHAMGDAGFVGRAERVALRPGATWHEQWRGTNAIGTALADAAPCVVHAGEHYLERNGFLTCAAAPIIDPAGRVLGVLDISGDQRGYHRHTLGLVRSAVRMIEHRLFDTRHGASLRLRFHVQPEGIGTLTEGLLALSDDGWVMGANAQALTTLGLQRQHIAAGRVERWLGLDFETLLIWARQAAAAPRQLRLPDGRTLWLRVEAGRHTLGQTSATVPRQPVSGARATLGAAASPPTAATQPSQQSDALAAIDTGDATLAQAIAKARRVLGKPIALLLQGESGVGKEVFARAVHASGPRAQAAFVAVNCAALPENLIEAELFGYQGGAFTGARREGSPGRIREAHGGTLFLDEIGDMPLALQARLLRVLQEREVLPLGGGKPVAVDFALVCASHHQLRQAIEAGRFREDLYYRLNGLTLQLPALRQRQDLAVLVGRLLANLAPAGQCPTTVAPALMQAFVAYRWPGNLRQLASALRTACALMAEGETEIDPAHLPDDLLEDLRPHWPGSNAGEPGLATVVTTAASSGDMAPDPLDGDLRSLATRAVTLALQAANGNHAAAARQLGISRNTLYRKLRAAGGV